MQQLNRQQKNSKLGARFVPKPPIGFQTDIFRARRERFDSGPSVSPLNPEEVFESKLMPGGRGSFFIYFPKKSLDSPTMTLVFPEIEFGGSREKVTFLFKFEVQKE